MLKPATAKTFNEYAQEVFTPYILSKFQQTTQLDLVWDRATCQTPSRARQGPREGKRSEDESGNWSSFLRVDDNKTELFSFLSGALLDSFQIADKQLVIMEGDAVFWTPQDNPMHTGRSGQSHDAACR